DPRKIQGFGQAAGEEFFLRRSRRKAAGRSRSGLTREQNPISTYDSHDHSVWPGSDRLKIAQQRRGVRQVGTAWGVMKVTGWDDIVREIKSQSCSKVRGGSLTFRKSSSLSFS